MIQRIKNSWNLMERSVDVLTHNPRLLLFPIVTFISLLFIFMFFLGTFLFQPTGHSYSEKAHWKAVATSVFTQESVEAMSQSIQSGDKDDNRQLEYNRTGLVIGIGIYFLSMFLATFFNVAFYHQIMEALSGRPVSVRAGFAFAFSKLGPILMWSLLTGVVGYLIKLIEQRVGFLGKIVVGLIGLAWSVAAVFAIPVIVCEQNTTNPFAVLKSSAQSIKRTWGETLIGFVGINLGVLFAVLFSTIPFAGMIFLAVSLNMPILIAISIFAWIIFIIAFSYFVSVASNVFHGALYVFASTGQLPPGYTREMMDAAWRHKPA